MFASDQFDITGKVISYLRYKPSPINRVGTAEFDAELVEFVANFFVAEDFFNAGLRVVEVAADSRDVDVVAGLSDHLQTLNFADAAVGIEDHDFCLWNICKTSQGRLARVARCCNED